MISLLKKEIRDGLSFIPGMSEDQRVRDIDLGMTNGKNERKFSAGYKCKFEIEISPFKIESKCLPAKSKPKGEERKSTISLSIGGNLVNKGEAPGGDFKLGGSLSGELQAKFPIGGILFIVLGLELELSLLASLKSGSKAKSSTEIKAYAGVGIEGKIGPFEAEAFLAGGIVYKNEDSKESWLWLVILEAEIDLVVVSVSIGAELQGYIDGGNGVASGEVAINVSIFLVINIKNSYTCQEEEKLVTI